MNGKEYSALKEAQSDRVNDVLTERSIQHAKDGDHLHNLKKAAALQGITLREALAGYMAEHTVVIYDMLRDPETWSMDAWEARIDEHIADLILLNAVIKEEDLERKGLNGLQPLKPETALSNHPDVDYAQPAIKVDAPTAAELASTSS